MKKNRILITGGAGFIGSHTAELLLQHNKKVVVLDNLSTGTIDNLPMAHPHLEFVEGDILDYDLLTQLIADCDAVLHLAAIASVPRSLELPVYTLQVNTQGTMHILEAIRKSNRQIRFVYASSSAVYGEAMDLPCQETAASVDAALSPYALQKAQSEEYAKLYERLFGIKSLGLRYFNVYGPRQDPASPYSGVISLFIDAYRANKEFVIFGDGRQSRDFIYVSDVAYANALALERDCSGALNIGTGESKTLLDLVHCIEQSGKRRAFYRHGETRPGDIRDSYGNVSKARFMLGFKASIPLNEGISLLLKQNQLEESKVPV